MPFVTPPKVPPNMALPAQTDQCMGCYDKFIDGIPVALVRSYSTKPGQPEWSWMWVCGSCLLEMAEYVVP